jgi:murein L,D-transpeptidase YcbB/YkuD
VFSEGSVAYAARQPGNSAFKKALDQAQTTLHISPRYFKPLKAFYRQRGYRPAWFGRRELSATGRTIFGALTQIHHHGLDPLDFPLPASASQNPQPLDDIKLSFSVIRYAEQVRAGRLSPGNIVAEHDLKANHPDLLILLKELASSDSPLILLNHLPPPHTQYGLLKTNLKRLRQQRPVLMRQSARVDRPLRLAATAKIYRLENLIIANMERWRWLPRDLGKRHIWINLPSYNVLIRNNGKTEFTTKGIIGRLEAPTPLISSRIKNIIVNPFWHIPASIVARDILPKLKIDPVAFLRSNSIKVLRRGGRLMDPAKINWAKVTNPRTYRFRQSPGSKNALGRLKILFPNRHAIYLHDTNEPELFTANQRAFSHGCVRLADPLGFADNIAAHDKHLQSQMPATLIGKREHWLKYKADMPVHLVYFTAVVEPSGHIIILPDIYQYDTKITRWFRDKHKNS